VSAVEGAPVLRWSRLVGHRGGAPSTRTRIAFRIKELDRGRQIEPLRPADGAAKVGDIGLYAIGQIAGDED
jgi:hypothetical protein